MLHQLAHRLDARRTSEVLQLTELALRVDSLRQHGDREPPLGLRTRGRIRLT
jgi:hypothetical protein